MFPYTEKNTRRLGKVLKLVNRGKKGSARGCPDQSSPGC